MKNLKKISGIIFQNYFDFKHERTHLPHPPFNCLDDNDVIAVIITKDFNSI